MLQKCLDSSLSFTVKTTVACVLHNFCLEDNDDWDSDNNDDSEDGGVLHDADEIRDLLKDLVCGNV